MGKAIELPLVATGPITCDDCGVCCMHMAAPPYDEEEVEMLRAWRPHVYADFRAAEETRALQFRATGVDQIPCGFFDMVTRRCRHHEHKPDICARYVVGDPWGCLEQRREAGLPT